MILALLLLALSVAAYSVSQLQIHGKLRGIKKSTSFFGDESFIRKYKNTAKGDRFLPEKASDTWYYRFFKIKYKERFPLSATFLISITDGYHLLQSLSFLSMAGCVSLLSGINFFIVWLGVIFVHALTYKLLSK